MRLKYFLFFLLFYVPLGTYPLRAQDTLKLERLVVSLGGGYQQMNMKSMNRHLFSYTTAQNLVVPFQKINGGPAVSMAINYHLGNKRNLYTSIQADYFWSTSKATFSSGIPPAYQYWEMEEIVSAFDFTLSLGYKLPITNKFTLSSQIGCSYILAYNGSRSRTDQLSTDYSGLLHDDIGYLIQLIPEYKILHLLSVYGSVAYRRALVKPMLNVAGSPIHEDSFGFNTNSNELEMDFSGMYYGLGLRLSVL